MAERENGGTSIGETTSNEATRPAAASSGTRSVRSIGRTAASRRLLASSSEIVDANGRMLPAGLLHHVTEFRDHEPPHRQPDRRLRPGERDDDAPCREAGGSAAHHRGGADLLEAEHPEELAEAVETLVEQAADRFVGAVA